MNDNTLSVVTVDTAALQRYVFSSNKLKENIGASYIIEELLYKQLMIQAIRDASQETAPDLAEEWKTTPEKIALLTSPDRKAEIGYIGGGNCMVLFRSPDAVGRFIESFSQAVLVHFPGIRTIFGKVDGLKPDTFVGDSFLELRRKLNQSMRDCRNLWYVSPTVYKPGIVEDCPSSNDAAEFPPHGKKSGKRWISGSTKAKLSAASDALTHIQGRYHHELGDKYTLTNEIEKLSKRKDKSYVAVVHADGNGVGKQFMEASSLVALRNLSMEVSCIADRVMRKLIDRTVEIIENDIDPRDQYFELERDEDSGKLILPIRPILAAGDDITFVCEGRLGVHLAAKILNFFEEESPNGQTMTACAGVAICKTHYPFFKAYTLAEDLISVSKKKSKTYENKYSWLHFLPVPSGFNGRLQDVLDQQFSSGDGELLHGPYGFGDAPEASYLDLIARLSHYCYARKIEDRWPRSKLNEMREAFRLSRPAQALFVQEAQARGLSFHTAETENLFAVRNKENRTPSLIFDMIQLTDFYPEILSKV